MLVIGAKIDYAFERFWDGGGQWTRTGDASVVRNHSIDFKSGNLVSQSYYVVAAKPEET